VTSGLTVKIVPDPDGCSVDVLKGSRLRVEIGEHGFVELVDISPRLCPPGRDPDFAVIRAARTSTDTALKDEADDHKLMRYLFRHRHTTPFEFVQCSWLMQLPIFVARQVVRHRTASINEMSGRYVELPNMFFVPESGGGVRMQGTANRQGGEQAASMQDEEDFRFLTTASITGTRQMYEGFLKKGYSRELSRIVLPVAQFTRWAWTADLWNTFHFLGLRMDPHAQKEVRDYADAMYEILRCLMPQSVAAFDDYHAARGALTFSRLELEALTNNDHDPAYLSGRELKEYQAKLKRIGR